jgi:hypothetical protein
VQTMPACVCLLWCRVGALLVPRHAGPLLHLPQSDVHTNPLLPAHCGSMKLLISEKTEASVSILALQNELRAVSACTRAASSPGGGMCAHVSRCLRDPGHCMVWTFHVRLSVVMAAQAQERNGELDEQLRRRKQDLQTFAEGYTVEESSKRVGGTCELWEYGSGCAECNLTMNRVALRCAAGERGSLGGPGGGVLSPDEGHRGGQRAPRPHRGGTWAAAPTHLWHVQCLTRTRQTLHTAHGWLFHHHHHYHHHHPAFTFARLTCVACELAELE